MIKLNCDLGESFGAWNMGVDEQIMPFIDMANIACGFHASDPLIMDKTVKLAAKHSVSLLFEAFADRRYADDGNLLSRNINGSVLEDDKAIKNQIWSLITEKQVTSVSGNLLSIDADTLCVHGDNIQALESVKSIRLFIGANFKK